MTAPEITPSIQDGLCELLPRLRRFARALTGDPHDADDLVQLALERALARASQWRPEQRLDAWMFGIVRNAWFDELRARRRNRQVFVDAEQGEQVGVSPVEQQQLAMSLQAALARLPAEQCEVIALVLVEGLAYREAAEVLQVPIGTVTSRLARGREALQSLLGGYDGKGG